MAFFPNSEVTIGAFRFSGVHQMRIKRSLFSPAVMATITVPAKAVVTRNSNGTVYSKPIANLFNYRDPVVIRLGYDGNLVNEFEGFVKLVDTNRPTQITCEGYIQQLRLNNVKSQPAKPMTAKQLLELVAANTDVSIKVQDGGDLPFTGLKLNFSPTAEDAIREIRRASNNILNVFFIDDKTLWCGLVYTTIGNNVDPFGLGEVNLQIGWNVIDTNSLKKRLIEGEPVIITGVSAKTTGERIQTMSEAKTAARREKAVYNNIGDKVAMQKLINEQQLLVNYTGYEGEIEAFLQPYCRPGFLANIKNKLYPDLDGKYLVTGTELTYGVNGAHRRIEIGPKMGFNTPTPKGA
jgi:hypothetical protein